MLALRGATKALNVAKTSQRSDAAYKSLTLCCRNYHVRRYQVDNKSRLQNRLGTRGP